MGNHSRLLAAVAVAILIAGCGNKTEDSGTESGTAPILTAKTLGEQVVLSAEDYLAAAPYAGADRAQGERQAQICRACHSLDKGGPRTPRLLRHDGRHARGLSVLGSIA